MNYNGNLRLFALALRNQICLGPEQIPRSENRFSDYLSRIIDHDLWQLNPLVVQMLDNVWGPHTIDQFASHYNTQLPRFNSRFASIGTESVNAFTVSCEGKPSATGYAPVTSRQEMLCKGHVDYSLLAICPILAAGTAHVRILCSLCESLVLPATVCRPVIAW